MKKYIAIVLVLCAVLTGCAGKPAPTQPSTEPTTEPTEAPTTQITEPTTEPTEPSTEPTEPADQLVSGIVDPFTGESLAAPVTDRPFAAVINNDKKALPHWGVGDAQMIWEMPHEFNVTRMVAMYTDISTVSKVGPNRSARPYLLSLARSFDALFVHAGYSGQAKLDLEATGWETINGVEGRYGYKYFHRDQARLDAGIAMEHTMYTTGPEVIAYCDDMGYGIPSGGTVDYGFRFSTDGTPENGETAAQIHIEFRAGQKKTDLYYDDTAGKYTMEQFGIPYIDGNDGETVQFENVLILEAESGILTSKGKIWVDLVSTGNGYFACGGKVVPIVWSRSTEDSPFRFTLTDGSPLTFGVGTTYAAVVYEGENKIVFG